MQVKLVKGMKAMAAKMCAKLALIFSLVAVLAAAAVADANINQAQARDQVGVLAASVGVVQLRDSTRSDAPLVEITPGAAIFLYDEIVTGPNTKAQILMMDETTFSVGDNTALIVDEFIYDPNDQGAGQIATNVTKGVFRFISGRIAKANPDNMKVKAGNAVISVRGTEVIGTISPEVSTIVLLSGQIDMSST